MIAIASYYIFLTNVHVSCNIISQEDVFFGLLTLWEEALPPPAAAYAHPIKVIYTPVIVFQCMLSRLYSIISLLVDCTSFSLRSFVFVYTMICSKIEE